jgi:epoxyqueuosine reductase
MTLTQSIKRQAQRLGFSLVGVTTPDPLLHEDVFLSWLKQGRHGEMAYLNTARSRECRAHPLLLFPECKSVLVLATHYPASVHPENSSGTTLRGRIAAYARGEDYHEVLPRRLESLVDFVEAQIGNQIPARWYTDTGPILERELAQRAGLGWIGKNTCLISPGEGSYFLLAEILLGLELEPDEPFSHDRCGTCQRCIAACPTGCILPDRTLDARRCISYLSIEHKGAIPGEIRPKMDGWVFGCDICQQVCPWNHFAVPVTDEAFYPASYPSELNLTDEIMLSTHEFNIRYRHSPLKRAKRRGYLRNVAIALGNLHDACATSILKQALLGEPEPLVRAHVAWALGHIGGNAAWQVLDSALQTELDIGVKSEIRAALDGQK